MLLDEAVTPAQKAMSKAVRAYFTKQKVKVRVKGEIEQTVAEGDGPVNALDLALEVGLTNILYQEDPGEEASSAYRGDRIKNTIQNTGWSMC